jgi:hypothetical protein
MNANTVLLILLCLMIKHFICDFPLQAYPYQYKNKGTYGHPGGILHSGLHYIGTWWVLVWFIGVYPAVFFALLDGVIHYHIDWAKMNINEKMGWTPTNSEKFWILLGVDQLLHALTYLSIVWMIV